MSVTNNFQVVDWLVAESLRILTNKLEVASGFNFDYNSAYTKPFAVGETVRIPLPWRPDVSETFTYDPQSIQRNYTTVTIDKPRQIGFEWDTIEEALRLTRPDDALRDQVITPCMEKLKQKIDLDAANFGYQYTNNVVGQLGTDPTTVLTVNQARQRIVENAGWMGKAIACVSPGVNVSLTNAVAQYFNPNDTISKQYKDGYLGFNNGFQFYESMSLKKHTAGTYTGAFSVSGGGQSGSTLLIAGTNNDVIAAGDVFWIGTSAGASGIYPVNPMTGQITNTNTPKMFRVLVGGTVSGGTVSVTITPPIVGPGTDISSGTLPYQNVDALPTAGMTVTMWPGTTSPSGKTGTQNLLFNKQAFAMVSVPLMMPKGSSVEIAKVARDPQTGITVSFIRQFDGVQRRFINRFDTLYGFGPLYNDNCSVVLAGA
jgi:hypothetical protein